MQECHYRSPSSSHQHHQQHNNHQQNQTPTSFAPSITFNYGNNSPLSTQSHREPRPEAFDISTDYWHTETDENFNYEVCYDRWWLPSPLTSSDEEQRPLSFLPPTPTTTPGKQLPDTSFRGPVYKQADKLTIPPIVNRSSVYDKLGRCYSCLFVFH